MSLLEGYRVLELGQDTSAPYCGFLLGEMGANVLKVEPPGGDRARRLGPPLDGGDSVLFATLNLHKRSVVIDWTAPRGGDLVRRLAVKADAVIEDLGPGQADALGMGYAALSQDNPRLVYCAVSDFGEAGPLRDMPGAELPLQAFAEYTTALGVLGQPPVRLGTEFGGMMTGVTSAQAVVAALIQREDVGKGQRVSTSILGTLMHLRGIMWAALSNPDDWFGFHVESFTRPPDEGYQVKDGHIFFRFRMRPTAESQERFHRMLDRLGLGQYKDDPRFERQGWDAAGSTARYYGELKPVWEQALGAFTMDEAIQVIKDVGGEAFPLNDYPRVINHPQTQHMGLVSQVRRPQGSPMHYVRFPANFSKASPRAPRPAPALGEHTDEALREAGVSRDEIARLRRDGIIG
ncbi:MAG: CoA transferase [Chloroflexi bacterium]|nr:CoA transferase [Chloroflexota bacterium]